VQISISWSISNLKIIFYFTSFELFLPKALHSPHSIGFYRPAKVLETKTKWKQYFLSFETILKPNLESWDLVKKFKMVKGSRDLVKKGSRYTDSGSSLQVPEKCSRQQSQPKPGILADLAFPSRDSLSRRAPTQRKEGSKLPPTETASQLNLSSSHR
jgi:hypothetical protein